jgi:hypothetical protein
MSHTNRSKKAARYGRLAEEAARSRYGLESEHTSWYDATTSDGRPVETKAAMLNRARGKGRFRVFEAYHRKLESAGGLYVFVAYEAAGRGIRVWKMRSVEASSMNLEFYGAGGHRDSRQCKIPVRAVFR